MDQAPAAHVRELAVRLLGLGGQPDPRGTTGRLYVGEAPPDLPLRVPVPDGGRLLGGSARWRAERLQFADVVIDAPLAPDDALTFFRRELEAQGWRLEPAGPTAPRGFMPGGFAALPAPTGTFARGEREPWLTVTAQRSLRGPSDPGGLSDVRLRLDGVNTRPSALPYWRDNPAALLIPALYVPEGVALARHGGGGGGPDQYSTHAVAETDMTAGALVSHFDRQLEALGWTRSSGAANGALAWSAWDVPLTDATGQAGASGASGDRGGEVWQGLLLVWTAHGPGFERRRSLSLRVDRVALAP